MIAILTEDQNSNTNILSGSDLTENEIKIQSTKKLVSERLLLRFKRTILQLYDGENKLYFDKMTTMMMSALY